VSGVPAGEERAVQGEERAVQGEERAVQGERALSVRVEGFACEALEQESARLGVPVEDLAGFAILYYLADVDSGRVARRISSSPYPSAPP
jgi:hypothetical protein